MVHSTAPDTAKAELFDSLALEGFQASPLLPRGWVYQVFTSLTDFFLKQMQNIFL